MALTTRNGNAHADTKSIGDSNCVCDVDPDVNAHAYSDSHCDGNTKADSHTSI